MGLPPYSLLSALSQINVGDGRTGSSSSALPLLPFPLDTRWLYVKPRFSSFLSNITPTEQQISDFTTKANRVSGCLDRHYWQDKQANDVTSLLIGSWRKATNVRTHSDIDLIFLLPFAVRDRYLARGGNIQSQVLQEVKDVLLGTYQNTTIKGDGPAVVIDFSTYKVEVIPSFRDEGSPREIENRDFKTWACCTKNGGSFSVAAPIAEYKEIYDRNVRTSGNLSRLVRMLKVWKGNCNVPIKSIAIERLAIAFLDQYPSASESMFWFDWIIRDFFAFSLQYVNGTIRLPLCPEIIPLGDAWASYMRTAYKNAVDACIYEQQGSNKLAGQSWQKIFGQNIPQEARYV